MGAPVSHKAGKTALVITTFSEKCEHPEFTLILAPTMLKSFLIPSSWTSVLAGRAFGAESGIWQRVCEETNLSSVAELREYEGQGYSQF
jgi:hypothetical protein